MFDAAAFHHLGIALALGLAVGVERGWHQRQAEEGQRVAGVRTFALSGLLGGIAQLLSHETGGPAILAVAFVLHVGLLAVGYVVTARDHKAYGMTTEVAGVATFLLGALAVAGRPLVAAAATAAMLVILRSKAVLHDWVAKLRSEELRAGITLVLISVVVLPLLPREPVDPWGALDLYEIWWMVVLVAALSFAGYAAVRALGPRRGLLLTAVLGGLASSTAVTLTFSRLARKSPESSRTFAACVVGACAIMPLRMLVIAATVHPPLLRGLAAPLVAMAVVAGVATVLLLVGRRPKQASGEPLPLKNPLDLVMALQLGLVLVVVLLLAEGVRRWFGEAGIYLLSAVSGLTDVDAITLSVSRLSRDTVALDVAVRGIVIAAAANTVVKAVLATVVGGPRLGRLVALGLGAGLVAGGVALVATQGLLG
jgi:uncharacterized membrane protein (DUF4010 family)